MAWHKRKGQSGEATKYISRLKAMRKLQLSLDQFTRLCIHKGVFPVEPKHRIKVQGGSSKYRPLYFKKDIKHMLHDPNISKYREEDRLMKKIKKARHLFNMTDLKKLKSNKPLVKLDCNVNERYPTFRSAVKDLSDALRYVFLFANVAAHDPIKEHHITHAEQLAAELMTYVIETKCLSKAFIAVSGYYYEINIIGEPIIFCVPHTCNTTIPVNVDLNIMKYFLEFYLTMVGNVMCRLLSRSDLRYPLKPASMPTLEGKKKKDFDNFRCLLLSLNYPLERVRKSEEEDGELESEMKRLMKYASPAAQKAYTESLDQELRAHLFKGQRFFLSRECNRTSLTFVIRACGGQVSWDKTVYPCSKYPESDQSITIQVCDRPQVEQRYITRKYVQPQWVYDCINAATILPVEKYLVGAELPPHTSPFVKDIDGWYVPPEEDTLIRLVAADKAGKKKILKELEEEEERQRELISAAQSISAFEKEQDKEEETNEEDVASIEEEAAKEEQVEVDMDVEENMLENDDVNKGKKKPEVTRGREKVVIEEILREKEEKREERMQAMMIPKKSKNLYHKLKAKEKRFEEKNMYYKERREAIEAHKMGKISQEELDYPKKKQVKLTYADKKKKKYQQKLQKAKKFATKEDKRRRKALNEASE